MLRTQQPYPGCIRDDGRVDFHDDKAVTYRAKEESIGAVRVGLVEPHILGVCADDLPRLPLVPKGTISPAESNQHLKVRDGLPLLWHQRNPVSGRLDPIAELPLNGHGLSPIEKWQSCSMLSSRGMLRATQHSIAERG